MTGELRHGEGRSQICRGCGGRKTPTAALCERCRRLQDAAEARGKLPPLWLAFALTGKRDPAYGFTCPECGGPKRSFHARRCGDCAGRGDPLHDVSRHESIITFADEDERVITRHCIGRNRSGQIADGLRQLPPGHWRPVCISNPASILRDLERRPVPE